MKAKFLALAALILGMVSCQTDVVEGLHVDANGEAELTLQVGLPEATRAAGADSALGAIGNVDMDKYDIRFILKVYDDKGELAKECEPQVGDATEAKFSLRLVPGRDYRFVVWADFVNQGSKVDLHYNTSKFPVISLNNGVAQGLNDESRDAYTAVYEVESYSSSSKIEPIILTRPFAKLRVITTDMNQLYSKLTSATVKYTSKLYTSFNALNQAVNINSSESFEKTVVYGDDTKYNGEPKNGEMTLFADYFFGSEDDRVMFTLDIADETGYDIPTVNFNTNIPVQRNHLTTVKGNILTDANEITVTIQENFDGFNEWPEENDNADQLEYASIFGGEVTLTGPVTISEGFIVRKPMTINLNGHTLKYTGDDVLFRVKEGASLTINGTTAHSEILTQPETLSSTGGNGYIAVVYEGCTLTFNGGTYKAQSTCTIAQANGGKIYVKGGTFQAKEYDTNGVKDHRYTFNHSDSLKDVGKIEITGGKFYRWNPFESHSENPAMNFVAKGYDAYPVDNNYYQVYSLEYARTHQFYTPSNRDLAFELLRTVFRNGGKVWVYEQHSNAADVWVTEALIADGVNVEIRGGGDISLKNGVTSVYEPGVASALICAKNGAKITFIDYSGDVNGGSEDYAIETRGGSIVVNGGQFKGAVSAAYALEGTITINGGTFEANDSSYGAQYLLNCYDANYNADPKKANIVVMGGTFKGGFNPANNAAEGPQTNFVAEGYTSTPDGSDWKVTRQ